MVDVDASLFNQGSLSQMAVSASQIFNTIPPFPLFYDDPSKVGSIENAEFPQVFCSVNCPSTGLPKATDNCLRIIYQGSSVHDRLIENPFTGSAIPSNLINKLPTSSDSSSNIFSNSSSRLYSLYVPPNYRIIFYKEDPSKNTLDNCGPYLEVHPNTVYPNMCEQEVGLTNGSTFFDYKPYTILGNHFDCKLAACRCSVKQNCPAYYNDDVTIDCPGVDHRTPYFIVIEVDPFSNIIKEMCLFGRYVTIGNNGINNIWRAQSQGCDNFMTNYCNRSDLNAEDEEFCACFVQQKELDHHYGKELDVPVMCFGVSKSGNVLKNCPFNRKAYKTQAMLSSACSFAECSSIVNKSPKLQENTPTPGNIECAGSLVQFPAKVTPTPSAQPKSVTHTVKTIPFWVWIMFGISGLLIIGFLISLSFVV